MPLVYATVSTLVAVLFVAFPGVDIWFSGLFWTPNEGWYLGDAWWVTLMYETVPFLVIGTARLLLGRLVHNLVRKRAIGPFSNRALLFVFLTFVIGPGLVVNVAFKDNWGRARPRDITEFGGERTFTPAFVISDQSAISTAVLGPLIFFAWVIFGASVLLGMV